MLLFYTGSLHLGLVPSDLPSLNLPTFDSDMGSSPAQLAAATAATHISTVTISPAHGVSTPQSQLTLSSTYSPASRLPRKLVEKILKLEFVEMSEMLPETWIPESQETAGVGAS